MKYYNNKKEITKEEAHDLKDKSGLIVKREKGGKKSGNK